MERVTWSVHPIKDSDEEGEGPLYALLPDDGTYGLRIGELDDIEAVYNCLGEFLYHGVRDKPIEDYHFQISPWVSVREAEEEYGIPRATLTWACRKGAIVGAEKLGNRWRFPLVTFRTWLRKRKS